MNINFEYKDVSASPRLEGLASEKINKLEAKYDFMVACDIYFKREKTSSDNTGRICEIRINVPGTTIFAQANNSKFESALAKASSEVQVQLQKKKDKMQTY